MPSSDPELEQIRKERLKEMQARQGFVDMRSVVDVRETVVHNKEKREQIETQQEGVLQYGFGALLDEKAQKKLSEISGGLHGSEKADRIESIITRMSQQGQLGGRKVTVELIFKLDDVVSRQYDTGSKGSMKFSRGKQTTGEESSDSDSD